MKTAQDEHQMGSHVRSSGEPHTATRDKEATRRRLLDAAEEVFAEKGYYATGVDDIIRASDSSKGGFYFHFPKGKQAIFLALIDALVPKLAAAVDRAISTETDPMAQLDAALRMALETFSRHRRLSKILLVEAVGLGRGLDEKLMRTRSYFAAMIQHYLDNAVLAGLLPPCDTVTISWAWFGAINELVVRWLVSGEPTRLEEVLPTLRGLLLRSVGAPVPLETSITQEKVQE